MSALDNRFFEHILTSDGFEAFRARFGSSTMILYSAKTKIPLAALIFHPKKSSPDLKCVLTARPSLSEGDDTATFQGLMSKDQEVFYLSIVNLNHKGAINFNILHTPHIVNEKDPGPAYGINEINEIYANEGYTIQADQRTGCEMKLVGKLSDQKDEKTGAQNILTVQDAESKDSKQREGTYFYLSVTGSTDCPGLVDKFREGSYWQCTNYLVRRAPAPLVPRHYHLNAYRPAVDTRSSRPILTTMQNMVHRGPEVLQSVGSSNEVLDGCSSEFMNQSIVNVSAQRRGKSQNQERKVPWLDIGKSQVAELARGEHVDVRGSVTNLEYDYESASPVTILSLSLYPSLQLFPELSKDDMVIMCRADMKEWKECEMSEILKTIKVFKSDCCVIDQESPADTVIVQCGHQCLNQANVGNLKTCPICRGHITSLIMVDDFNRVVV